MKIRGKDIVKKGTGVSETWDRIDRIIEAVGEKSFIEMYIKAESDDNVNSNLDYMIDANELQFIFAEDEEDEY